MTDSKSTNKTPENVAKAVSKYKKKHNRQQITVDLYLDDETEKEMFDYWKSLGNKKEFFIQSLLNHKAAQSSENKR